MVEVYGVVAMALYGATTFKKPNRKRNLRFTSIIPTFFLYNIGQEKVFYDTLQRKNAFLGNK